MAGRWHLVLALPVPLILCQCADYHDDYSYPPSSGGTGEAPGPVESYRIDTGAVMAESTPGEGAGVFVEYQSGGRWHVYLSCDTRSSGAPCEWDIVTTVVSSGWSGLVSDQLEPTDTLGSYAAGPWLLAQTTNDLDGFYFSTTPGASVRFDVLLDGTPMNGYAYWILEEAVNPGASSNPFELKPSTP